MALACIHSRTSGATATFFFSFSPFRESQCPSKQRSRQISRSETRCPINQREEASPPPASRICAKRKARCDNATFSKKRGRKKRREQKRKKRKEKGKEKKRRRRTDRVRWMSAWHNSAPEISTSCERIFDWSLLERSLRKMEGRRVRFQRQRRDSSDSSTKGQHAGWHPKGQRALVSIPFAVRRVPSGRTGAVDHSACRSRGDWVGPRLRLPVTHSGSHGLGGSRTPRALLTSSSRSRSRSRSCSCSCSRTLALSHSRSLPRSPPRSVPPPTTPHLPRTPFLLLRLPFSPPCPPSPPCRAAARHPRPHILPPPCVGDRCVYQASSEPRSFRSSYACTTAQLLTNPFFDPLPSRSPPLFLYPIYSVKSLDRDYYRLSTRLNVFLNFHSPFVPRLVMRMKFSSRVSSTYRRFQSDFIFVRPMASRVAIQIHTEWRRPEDHDATQRSDKIQVYTLLSKFSAHSPF